MLARTGFALWLGPTQAPTPSHSAGVFLRGRALPGQVVGVFPGAVYNSEMRQKAVDFGHFANPAVQRIILPRFDDTILDVHGAGADVYNPLAVAHHARHPPAGVTPNVMRLQYDYVDDENSAYLHGLLAGRAAFTLGVRGCLSQITTATWTSRDTFGRTSQTSGGPWSLAHRPCTAPWNTVST